MNDRMPGLDSIDWDRPWLTHLRPLAQSILQAPDWRNALNAAASAKNLSNHRGLAIRFVPQANLPPGTAYEGFISATGQVPTRSNLHDFFNALVWLTFPKIKVQLNALQAAELDRAAEARLKPDGTVPVRRGKVRDAATIFDENAAIFVTAYPNIAANLRSHQWQELFLEQRAAYGRQYEVWLFGHALMEKLVSPYKAITAHTWIVSVNADYFALDTYRKLSFVDATIANRLMADLGTSNFSPLPVLGIPGWWEPQDKIFYDDAQVFRPKRPVGTKPNP